MILNVAGYSPVVYTGSSTQGSGQFSSAGPDNQGSVQCEHVVESPINIDRHSMVTRVVHRTA